METDEATSKEEETPEGTMVGEGRYNTIKATMQIHSVVRLRRRLKHAIARASVPTYAPPHKPAPSGSTVCA